eukprot:m.16919 g.16919  ORF g.16919 m.16919 type:complete len:465 (+) comp3439_c0_seq1:250-1644(+)
MATETYCHHTSSRRRPDANALTTSHLHGTPRHESPRHKRRNNPRLVLVAGDSSPTWSAAAPDAHTPWSDTTTLARTAVTPVHPQPSQSSVRGRTPSQPPTTTRRHAPRRSWADCVASPLHTRTTSPQSHTLSGSARLASLPQATTLNQDACDIATNGMLRLSRRSEPAQNTRDAAHTTHHRVAVPSSASDSAMAAPIIAPTAMTRPLAHTMASTSTHTHTPTHIHNLPDELMELILTYCDCAQSLGRAAQVCRHWRHLLQNKAVWRRVVLPVINPRFTPRLGGYASADFRRLYGAEVLPPPIRQLVTEAGITHVRLMGPNVLCDLPHMCQLAVEVPRLTTLILHRCVLGGHMLGHEAVGEMPHWRHVVLEHVEHVSVRFVRRLPRGIQTLTLDGCGSHKSHSTVVRTVSTDLSLLPSSVREIHLVRCKLCLMTKRRLLAHLPLVRIILLDPSTPSHRVLQHTYD